MLPTTLEDARVFEIIFDKIFISRNSSTMKVSYVAGEMKLNQVVESQL